MGAGVAVYPYDEVEKEVEDKHEACLFYGWSQSKKTFCCTLSHRYFNKDCKRCNHFYEAHFQPKKQREGT